MNWINRFAVFPSSEKEMTTLISLLKNKNFKYEIDYPKSFKFKKNIISRNLDEQEWENIDTLVLGYFYDHPFVGNVYFGFKLIKDAILKNKNLFIFNNQKLKNHIDKKQFESYNGHIYSPIINMELYHKIMSFDHLPKVKIPIIAVVGTTNRQGKFSTQVRLKEVFEQNGYSVSMLSTEPHGELLGGAFSFPYGFSSTVNIPRCYWRNCIKAIIKGISYYNESHIIFTGTQGGLLPQNNVSMGNETCSLDFLLGVEPDSIICAINPQDTVKEIEKTTLLAKYYSNADVLFYTLTPWERNYQIIDNKVYANHKFLDREAYEKKKLYFKNKLGKEIINIMDDKDILKSITIIENFFSK
jgi:uncharacterized NAD-dependent epimerase/dehydratase family protein